MAKHEWIPSKLGHGEQQCKYCLMTNREATVLGDECPTPEPTPAPKERQRRTDWMKRATDAADAHDAYIASLEARLSKLETRVDDDYGINFENAKTVTDRLAPLQKQLDALQASFDEVVKASLHSIQGKVNGVIGDGFVEKTEHEKRIKELLESNTALREYATALTRSLSERTRELAREKREHAATVFVLRHTTDALTCRVHGDPAPCGPFDGLKIKGQS